MGHPSHEFLHCDPYAAILATLRRLALVDPDLHAPPVLGHLLVQLQQGPVAKHVPDPLWLLVQDIVDSRDDLQQPTSRLLNR